MELETKLISQSCEVHFSIYACSIHGKHTEGLQKYIGKAIAAKHAFKHVWLSHHKGGDELDGKIDGTNDFQIPVNAFTILHAATT